MKVFLYEFISGGGCFHPTLRETPSGSLLAEGLAMWQAVYEDLSRLAEVQVLTTRDARLPFTGVDAISVDRHDSALFLNLAKQVDVTLVIAPEFDGHLLQLVSQLERVGCRQLGPDASFIRLTSDKTKTLEHLAAAGIRVPVGQLLKRGQSVTLDMAYPMVAKRNDGAGSMGSVLPAAPSKPFEHDTRLEAYLAGEACSQSLLCHGGHAVIACPPMRQWIAGDLSLQYLGGERLQHRSIVNRATDLATQVIQALPETNGYVGVDMILGQASDGSQDYVLEVNPRLTTSYIGLRQLTEDNLMQVLIDIAQGNLPSITFDTGSVSFRPDGTIQG